MNLVWLVPALPLLGFLVNGAVAFVHPKAKRFVSVVGVGVLVASFGVALQVARALAQAHAEAPVVFRYWDWMPVGSLQVSYALQVDALSAVMMLEYLGFAEAGERMRRAVDEVYAEGRSLTVDQNGRASTEGFLEAVAGKL